MTRTPHPPLGVLDPPLARAEPARGAPLRVAGARVALHLDGLRGLTASYTRSGLLTGPIRLEDTRAANVLHAPGLVRRELVGIAGGVWETWIAPERLAGFAVQWEAVGPAPAEAGSFELVIELPGLLETPPDRPPTETTCVLADPAGSGSGLTLAVEPGARWTIEPSALGTRVRAGVRPEPFRRVVTLQVAEGTGPRSPSLTALGNLTAHLKRAYARVVGDGGGGATRAGGIALDTGVTELDDGVAWARQALLDGRVPAPAGAPRTEAADSDAVFSSVLEPAAREGWQVLGALVGGDHELATELLPDDPDHPIDLFAWTAWVRWTGEPGRFVAAASGLRSRYEALSASPGPVARAWGAFLRGRLAEAFEAAGARGVAAELRAGRAAAGRSLPTVSAAPERATTLEAILGEAVGPLAPGFTGPVASATDVETGAEGLLVARALYETNRPDDGFPALRRTLGRVAHRGPSIDGLREAAALWALVTGLFGVRADAPVGRLRFAPRLPAHWRRLSLRSLRMGDASIDVDFEADGGTHEWRFRPVEGSVPATLIFEPSLALRAPLVVHIDGRPATLGEHVTGGRVTMGVQLPLDSERSITVEGARPEG